ncbi:MAG TPA: serine hydrolase, partial [Halalkalibaculum sp.]|nr:serine hydrolase [Halalkalibaculum sp.]
VSVASIAIENPDSSILYNEHTPRSMGILSNIFTVIEYARQVEGGELDPNEQVSLSEVAHYQLPYMDASNHSTAVEQLEDREMISDQNSVAIADLVQVSVEFNDLAASDYLFFRFGSARLDSLLDRLNIEETESPLPFSGMYTFMKPSFYDMEVQQRMDTLSSIDRETFDSLAIDAARKLAENETFREEVFSQFRRDEGLGIPFTLQRDLLDFFPKTTAWEMANLMKSIQQEELISAEVSRRIKEIMSWPLKSSRLQSDFSSYGAYYDSRLGLVNGIDFGASTYTNEPFAQAVFFDDLQLAFWFHMSSNLIHQDFEQRLIWDPALRQATVNEIRKNQ